jgi:5-methylthioadenosine/S-adenosylhomocysteine deaminase
VFCENGSSVDSVIANGEVVVERGRLTKVDEMEILRRAAQARARLDPSIQLEMAAAKAMESSLSAMYFRIFR